ncbi:WhiB family transcriptional regulator [Streptomyces sp. NBC_00096]|uniref:WhiB family transcriptional regulator n=1 Tax=Streptomyces sp. NBC_00096 TaxID=2975650 RepID=UPI003253F999
MGNASRLPGSAEHHWLWQEGAACRELGSRLFFHPTGEQNPDREARDEAAKEVCALCPVQRECLRHALEAGETFGIWGGLTEGERRRCGAAGGERPALSRPA